MHGGKQALLSIIQNFTARNAFCLTLWIFFFAEVGDEAQLIIKYGSLQIENGQTISPDELLTEPSIEILPKNQTYTLMMVDADAPAPTTPKYRSWLHWLVINIPGNDVTRGEEVESYTHPEPSHGKHRYLFLVFKQKNRVSARRPAKRQGFQVKEWAMQHGLDPNPAGGLFFWSAADAEEE
jgi:phosphatidylethanolamine-binding protein (PEBP) family uncharacterized protein